MSMQTSLEMYNHIFILKTEIIFYFEAVLNAAALISIKNKKKRGKSAK